MITYWVLERLASFVVWLVGLVTIPPLPDAVTTGLGYASTLAEDFAPFRPLFPLGLVSTWVAVILGLKAYAIAVRVIRWVQSSFTGGGGVSA